VRVAVIGGGLAGLAAGCELAERGHRVTLFERRPWAGGKTYSFVERETGEVVDNGQHIFMACTTAYIAFLRRLGTLGLTRRQRRLRVPVFDAAGRRSDLWAAPLPTPLHLGPSFAAYRHLSPAEKARVARGILAILRLPPGRRGELEGETFGDWLRRNGQSPAGIRDFWNLIVVPTLNCPVDEASAAQALFVFQEGFLKSSTATAIGVPAAGLSRLHVDPAIRHIEWHGGEVRLSRGVDQLEIESGHVAAVRMADGERLPFDAYVAATPPRELLGMLPPATRAAEPFVSLARLRTAPIVNLHLWFDGPVADFDFAAFTGTDLQWIFNRTRIGGSTSPPASPALTPRPSLPNSGEGEPISPPQEGEGVCQPGRQAGSGSAQPPQHLVVSLSAAARYMDLDKRELQALFLPQIQRALPRAAGRRLVRFVAIKEPDATFVPAPGAPRPPAVTPIPNLFLAGAYTSTGWPATMESAVRSGLTAARAVDACRIRPASAEQRPAEVSGDG
jgi:squalene-associated FAD-dependent desaturase